MPHKSCHLWQKEETKQKSGNKMGKKKINYKLSCWLPQFTENGWQQLQQ